MKTVVGIDQGVEAIRGVLLRNPGKGPVELVSAGQIPLGELGRMEDNDDRRLALGEKLRQLVKGARLRGNVKRVAASGKAASLHTMHVPPVPPWRLDMLVAYEVEGRGDKEPAAYDYRILDMPDVGGQYTVLIGTCRERDAEGLLAEAAQAKLGEVEIDLEPLALYNAYYHGHGYDPDKTVLLMNVGAEEVHVALVRNGALYMARTFMGGGSRFTQVLAEEFKLEFEEAEELKRTEAEIRFDLPAGGDTTITARGRGSTRTAPSGTTLAILRRRIEERRSAGAKKDDPSGDGPTGGRNGIIAPSLKGESGLEAGGREPAAPAADEGGAEKGGGDSALKRAKRISGVLLREAAALCAAVENSVAAFRNQSKLRDLKVERVYLTGGGARLTGLSEFIGRRLRAEVVPLEPLRKLSLNALPPAQVEELKKEQHTMATALGVALGELLPGTFSFLLWPRKLVEKKEFRSRGAFLWYAAAMATAALVLCFLWLSRNNAILAENNETAESAAKKAKRKRAELTKLLAEHDEIEGRFQQIDSNIASGHYFMRVLAELKDTRRIPDYIYLTEISTRVPRQLAVKEDKNKPGTRRRHRRRKDDEEERAALRREAVFQAEQRIYLRGFAVAPQNESTSLLKRLEEFFQKRMMPDQKNPDSPKNMFQDIRIGWFEMRDHCNPDHKNFVLMEFILEAYIKDVVGAAHVKSPPVVPAVVPTSRPPAVAPTPPVPPTTSPVPPTTKKNFPPPNTVKPTVLPAVEKVGPPPVKKAVRLPASKPAKRKTPVPKAQPAKRKTPVPKARPTKKKAPADVGDEFIPPEGLPGGRK